MDTFLLTWNPQTWDWQDLEDDIDDVRDLGSAVRPWSCGNTKRIKVGDRLFLRRLGRELPVGIMASGYAISDPYEGAHYNDDEKTALIVDAEFDILLNPKHDKIL